MILSNPSSRPELDHKAITTLGDTLGSVQKFHFIFALLIKFLHFQLGEATCMRRSSAICWRKSSSASTVSIQHQNCAYLARLLLCLWISLACAKQCNAQRCTSTPAASRNPTSLYPLCSPSNCCTQGNWSTTATLPRHFFTVKNWPTHWSRTTPRATWPLRWPKWLIS